MRISELLVAHHHSNLQDKEWQHIRGFLHELKSEGFLLVKNEGEDIYNEQFGTTPDRIKKYFSKNEVQDNSDLTIKTDEELEEILRRNDNPHIATSLHSRALLEMEIRHKRKIEQALQKPTAADRGKTVKAEYKTKDAFVQTRSQGGDHHILMGKRDGTEEKAHMIVDENDGSLRLEDGRQEPTEIAPLIEVIITFPDGQQIRSTRERIEEVNSDNVPVIDVEKVGFSQNARTKEKLAESFSVSVPILIRNFSAGKISLRNIQAYLEVPAGYDCRMFYSDIKNPEDFAAKDFVSRTFQFMVSITGGTGVMNAQNSIWEENKNKIIANIASAKFTFHIKAESVALKGVSTLEKSFDLNSEILPHLLIN